MDCGPAVGQARRRRAGGDARAHDPQWLRACYRGVEAKAFVYTEREASYARLMPVKVLSDSGKAVRCPMPGLIVSLAVAEGQEVKAGETLAVVEAMKMENILRAERDGAIKKSASSRATASRSMR